MVDVSSQPLNPMPLKLYWCHLKGFWSRKLPPITSSLPTWCPGVVVFKKYRMAKFTLANITAFQTHSSSQKLLKFDCWILFYKFHTKLIFNSLVFSEILSNISTKLMSTSNFTNNNDKNNSGGARAGVFARSQYIWAPPDNLDIIKSALKTKITWHPRVN